MSMADIKCPFCGKENPEENLVCWFCQALLQAQDTPGSGQDDTDWLRALGSPSQDASQTPQPDDWLASLRSASPENSAMDGARDGEDDQPDWMVNEPDHPSAEVPDNDLIDRLEALSLEVESNAQTPDLPAPASGTPEFDIQSPAMDTPGEDLPDWLAELQRARLEPDQPALNDQPFSLNEDLDETAAEDVPALITDTSAAPAEPEETPDWLAGLMAEQPDAEAAPPEPFALEEAPAFQPPAVDGIPAAPAEPEETPDWLAGLMAEQPMEQDPSSQVPAWMDAETGETPASSGIFTTSQERSPAGGEETPDWLAELQQDLEQPPREPVPPGEILTAGEEIQRDHPNFPQEPFSDGADWLADLQPQSSEPYQPPPDIPDAPAVGSEISEWSPGESEFLTPAPEPPGDTAGSNVFTYEAPVSPLPEGEIEPFTGDDLPDWLSLIATPSEPQPCVNPNEPPDDPSLSPAAIPNWLEAMRPVTTFESANPSGSSDEEGVQPSGPLAGLRGVLTSAAAGMRYPKPPMYSAALQISELQKQQAGLLEDTLSSEKHAAEAAKAARRTSQRWVRVIMGSILIIVLLAALLFTPSVAPPAAAGDPSRVLPFQKVLSALPPNSPILVAVDYNAGYAGEMRFSAGYVVQELIVRQSRLAWVSTLPTGPILAEDLQRSALLALSQRYNQPDLTYLVTDKTVNLGYLAGGVTSLQEFASQPLQAARYGLAGGLDGASVWSQPALSGIRRLSDFSALIVITDDAGVARAWVEQVQPALAGTPLLLVASAQAAPMAAPYLESGQVDALLSGMGDGMAYQRLTSTKAAGRHFWRAYQAGIGVIMLFTLLGAALQFVIKPGASSKPKRKSG